MSPEVSVRKEGPKMVEEGYAKAEAEEEVHCCPDLTIGEGGQQSSHSEFLGYFGDHFEFGWREEEQRRNSHSRETRRL
jgi:hypothetical protein